jgi:hypothetical protein
MHREVNIITKKVFLLGTKSKFLRNVEIHESTNFWNFFKLTPNFKYLKYTINRSRKKNFEKKILPSIKFQNGG